MPAIEYAGRALELASVGADVTPHPHCVFSAGARVVTGTELVKGEGLTNATIPADFRAVRRSFVHLERHAFLGTNAVGHPGVTIGEGAVVGSGAVVTRDVEPWTIVHGVPARPVGTRPSARIRELADRCYERLGIGPLDPTSHLALKTETLQLPRA
jgi:galactoside O-acetyltransferase